MEEVFEPVTAKQAEATTKQIEAAEAATEKQIQASEKQLQALRDSSLAIQESSNTLQKSIKEGIQEYDEITNRNNQTLTSLVITNQVDSSIIKTVSNLLNDKNKSQFSLEPIKGNPYLFTINPYNPQQVIIKGSTRTFENGNSYDLNDPDLQYFITNTKFREINNKNIIYSFLNVMNYNINYRDKKSIRYYFIKDLHNQYYQPLQGYAQSFAGSGINGEQYTKSSHLIQTN